MAINMGTGKNRPPNPDGTYGIYWLGTHGVDVPDPNDPGAGIKAPHCSCASLVEWCYEEIGVDLVFADDLPHYSGSEVKSLFCPWISEQEIFERLESFGLLAPGPWPLLLPAHQMKAFKMRLEDLPHHGAKVDHPSSDELRD